MGVFIVRLQLGHHPPVPHIFEGQCAKKINGFSEPFLLLLIFILAQSSESVQLGGLRGGGENRHLYFYPHPLNIYILHSISDFCACVVSGTHKKANDLILQASEGHYVTRVYNEVGLNSCRFFW